MPNNSQSPLKATKKVNTNTYKSPNYLKAQTQLHNSNNKVTLSSFFKKSIQIFNINLDKLKSVNRSTQ